MCRFFLIIFITLFSTCLTGCKRRDNHTINRQSNYSVYIPETGIYLTTSKRENGVFYVFFSKKPYISMSSMLISYIECETMDSDINIILNPKEKNHICFTYPSVRKINQKDLKVSRISEQLSDTLFYEKRIKNMPRILKKPFIQLTIIPSTYTIIIQNNPSFKSQKRIKEGDIYGGW